MSTDSTTQTKHCPKCGRDLPATPEYFHRNKQAKSGLHTYCKECKTAHERNHYANDDQYRTRILERTTQYAKDHPKQRREISRRYYENHRETEMERSRIYNAENKHVRRAWYERNKPRLLEREQQRREANKEQYREASKAYYQSHKAEALHRWRIRQARKLNAEGSHTKDDLRAIRAAQTDKQGSLRCWYCGKSIEGAPHLDHKIPLARGGSNGPENLCYACSWCNRSKSAKTPAEFVGRLI